MRHLNYTLATLPVMKSNFCKIHETEKKNRSFDFVFFQAWSFTKQHLQQYHKHHVKAHKKGKTKRGGKSVRAAR